MTRSNDRKPKSNTPEPFDEAFGEMLCAYLDDELAPAQRAEVEARLESDATARAQLEMLTSAASAMRSLPRGSAPSSILEDITAQSERAEILGKPEDTITLARHKRGPFRSTMALAAMLMVAVSASVYVSLNSQQKSPHARTVDMVSTPKATQPTPPDEAVLAMREESKRRGHELTFKSDGARDFDDAVFKKERAKSSDAKDVQPTMSSAESDMRLSFAESRIADASIPAVGDDAGGVEPLSRQSGTHAVQAESAPKSERAEPALDEVNAPAVTESFGLVTQADTELGEAEKDAADASPPPPAPASDHAEQPARQLAKFDADMTLEQKLMAGADAAVVASHPFPNEPLQLSVSFDNLEQQVAGEKQLQAFLGRNSFRPIETAATSRGYANSEENENGVEADEVVTNESNALECESYYVGHEGNYETPVNSRQYLVRISSDNFAEVVNDFSTIGAEDVQLRVGNVLSQNSEELWQLASQAANEEFEPPATARAQLRSLRRALGDDEFKKSNQPIEESESFPETAQWIMALQSYGLLPDESADEPQFAGGLGGDGGGNADATTNALPTDTAPSDAKMTQKQQTLLTLVIELINDEMPGKKESPTKVKQ